MDFDDLLSNHIGPFGKFQALCFLGYAFHALPYYLAVIECVYQGVIPKHYCKDALPDVAQMSKYNLTAKDVINITSTKLELATEQHCYAVQHNSGNTTISKEEYRDHWKNGIGTNVSNPEKTALSCTHHIYQDEEFGKTIVEQVLSCVLFHVQCC